jgi:hypothetical protein
VRPPRLAGREGWKPLAEAHECARGATRLATMQEVGNWLLSVRKFRVAGLDPTPGRPDCLAEVREHELGDGVYDSGRSYLARRR